MVMKTQQNKKNTEFMHNRIMLTLKIILNQMTAEADMKDC
jgi:hypothetical protein